jgi:hypothetical protein
MVSAARRRVANVVVCGAMVVTGACTPATSPSAPVTAASAPAAIADTNQSPPAPTGPGSVPCGDAIDAPADTPPDLVVVLDNVALPVGWALQANPAGQSESGLRLFAKQGLVVRAGVPVELRVPAEWETRVRMAWGSTTVPGNVVTLPACPTRGQAPWLAFAGGYWVDAAVCFPLVVRTAGRETQVRIGVGETCSPG